MTHRPVPAAHMSPPAPGMRPVTHGDRGGSEEDGVEGSTCSRGAGWVRTTRLMQVWGPVFSSLDIPWDD